NLNAIEEAQGYAQLIEQFHLTQDEAGKKVGKSRAVVANALRLLKLPTEVQGAVREGRISVGHAKVILGLASADLQRRAAERVLKQGLNVRQTEELVTRLQTRSTPGAPAKGGQPTVTGDAQIADLEARLQERLGTKVSLRYAQGKGTLEIRFFNDADLERVLQIIGVQSD